MLNLNLIPLSLKKEVKLKVVYLKLKNFLQIIIFILTVYVISILVSRLILEIHHITTIEETTVAVKSAGNYSHKVRAINGQVDFIDNIQKDFVNWSYLLEYFNQNLGNSIEINQLRLSKNPGQVTIIGFAATRDSLIQFKDLLEFTNFLESVEFPISNILEKENITFEISAKLLHYEFK